MKLHGIEIHARSIYLQGLLLMSEERLPSYLEEARQYTSKLQELSGKCGLTSSQLALLFVRDISEIDRVIIGCESTDQLEDNVNSFGLPKLEESLFLEILDTFKEISDDIVNPTKWRR
ncbi:Aldo/keto reductase family protein [compost metagenome]